MRPIGQVMIDIEKKVCSSQLPRGYASPWKTTLGNISVGQEAEGARGKQGQEP